MESDVRDRHPRLQLLLQLVILYSAVTMILGTVPELAAYAEFFRVSEVVCVTIFTIEYVACWTLSRDRLRYPWQPLNVIDLLAIAPFFLYAGLDFRLLRALRFLRVFRLLKVARYGHALDNLYLVVKQSRAELAITGLLAGMIVVISSMLLYYAEHEAQPDKYASVPAAMWSAIVTLTTVGYGDVYPVTTAGRVIAVFVMLAGISFIAIPTGLVSSRLTDILTIRRDTERQQLIESVRYREE